MNQEPEKLDIDMVKLDQKLIDEFKSLLEQADEKHERYDLSWSGKARAFLEAGAPIDKVLRPNVEESVDFEDTENLFITGDNLDALKLLQESYLGKVDMIYIDPPYNTGKDFVYRDKFSKTMSEAIDESKDEEGNRQFTVNSKDNGRYHSDWLSMMYPRLRLARNLLKNTGVVFISIDDNELANLKLLCDELFGESNFVEYFSWVKTSTPPGLSNKSRKTVEYILAYEKNINNTKYRGELLDGGDQPLMNSGNNRRVLKFPKDSVKFNIPDGTYRAGSYDRVNLLDTIEINNGRATADFSVEGEFKWIQSTLLEEVQKGTTFIVKSKKFSIRFIRVDDGGYKAPTNLLKEKYISPILSKKQDGVDTNDSSSTELSELLGGKYFDFPKPVSLVKHLINFICPADGITLDFFAGSGTTAHAVMKLNKEDGGNRKFILATLDEQTPEGSEARKAGYDTIDQISRERIRRAAEKLGDTSGFRSLHVADSNHNDVFRPASETSQTELLDLVDNTKKDRTPLDLLYGVLTASALELNRPLKEERVGENTIYKYDYLGKVSGLIACFDKKVDEETIKKIAEMQPLSAVFKDSSFVDSATKVNLMEHFRTLSPETRVKVI